MKKLLRIQIIYIVKRDTNTTLQSIITRPIRISVHRVQEQTCNEHNLIQLVVCLQTAMDKKRSPKATYNIELLQPAQTAVMFKLLIFRNLWSPSSVTTMPGVATHFPFVDQGVPCFTSSINYLWLGGFLAFYTTSFNGSKKE